VLSGRKIATCTTPDDPNKFSEDMTLVCERFRLVEVLNERSFQPLDSPTLAGGLSG
jgi:uncharacterized protein YhfF